MRTRTSVRNQNTLYRELFQPEKDKPVEAKRPAYLDMTDEQIDKVYWNFGKADKTRMKKQAAQERQRRLTLVALDAGDSPVPQSDSQLENSSTAEPGTSPALRK